MFWSADLANRSERRAFERALRAAVRQIRIQVQFYDRKEKPLPIRVQLADEAGEVVIDTTDPDTPTRTAHINVLDPLHKIPIDGAHATDGRVWASKMIGISWGLWVHGLGKWVDTPLFRGWIDTVARTDDWIVTFDAYGKDGQHLGDYRFPHPVHVRDGTPVVKAIKHILRKRGENKLDFNDYKRELGSDRNYPRGATPWRACRKLAALVEDTQLYYRGNGFCRFRNLPNRPSVVFKEGPEATVLGAINSFSVGGLIQEAYVLGTRVTMPWVTTRTKLSQKAVAGATNVKVDVTKHMATGKAIRIRKPGHPKEEVRKISSVDVPNNTIHFTTNDLDRFHPKGAPVRVRHRKERKVRHVGVARLKGSHPLSSRALTGGDRPLVHVEDIGQYSRKKDLDKVAQRKLRRMRGGIDQSVEVVALIDPRLEELDVTRIARVQGVSKTMRVKRCVFHLSVEGLMGLNWEGEHVPSRKDIVSGGPRGNR